MSFFIDVDVHDVSDLEHIGSIDAYIGRIRFFHGKYISLHNLILKAYEDPTKSIKPTEIYQ